jgi:hypothetical protein
LFLPLLAAESARRSSRFLMASVRDQTRSIAINGTRMVSMVRLFSSSLQTMMFDLKAWERGGRAAFFGLSKRISIHYGA